MGHARNDRLCGVHADMLKNKELICLNDNDSDFYCTKDELKSYNVITRLPTHGYSRCLQCNEKTKGYAFCKSCWNAFDEKTLLEIINEKEKIAYVKANRDHESDDFSVFWEQLLSEPPYDENEKNVTKEHDSIPVKIEDEEKKATITIDPNNKSRCIICGYHTDGLLFCGACYQKYKEKELLIKISKCKNIELLDETYESIYRCKDGHMVKSKSERDIDNYLYENKIQHVYEPELPYGKEGKVIHPDFKLPNYLGEGKDVYLEHWGFSEKKLSVHANKKIQDADLRRTTHHVNMHP